MHVSNTCMLQAHAGCKHTALDLTLGRSPILGLLAIRPLTFLIWGFSPIDISDPDPVRLPPTPSKLPVDRGRELSLVFVGGSQGVDELETRWGRLCGPSTSSSPMVLLSLSLTDFSLSFFTSSWEELCFRTGVSSGVTVFDESAEPGGGVEQWLL